ncbi:hypothetical protein HPP92_007156 [Vanilla planifolia]|uniref:Uncharacterized protein n=1 Tax=Vanilla planifolia TaxID=51239 RepID=A0A835R9Y1_VANPL|nr:hypothetical protein HPP92_007156 [Vanilla planifolia]
MSSARIDPRRGETWSQKEGLGPASVSRNNGGSHVRYDSGRLFDAGKGPSASGRPQRRRVDPLAAASIRAVATADGFGIGTPVPNPQSQSFSRSYGSILPTSLAYIAPSTRGCSPWRPDAVMSNDRRGRHFGHPNFSRVARAHRTPPTCGALPTAWPYLRLSRFQGRQAVKQKR